MPKQFVPAAGKRGGPRGPVDPFTTLVRHMAKPNHAAALLARLIAYHYGEKLQDAVVSALVLLTAPAQCPACEWPDRVAWFHDWWFSLAGPLHGSPTRAGVKQLLEKGKAPGLRKRKRY
jgi:hypothetical protein